MLEWTLWVNISIAGLAFCTLILTVTVLKLWEDYTKRIMEVTN